MNARVASLLPSATEIVCAVGARDELVGISHECDFPPGLEGLPVLTRARLRGSRSSRGIDAEVRSIIEDALSVYEIELDRLEAAQPDVIVTQDLCDVCAVSLDDVHAAVARLAKKDVRIVNLHPKHLDDIWSDILRVADALGRAEQGVRAIFALRGRTNEIEQRSARAALAERPRVLSVEWMDPVMIGGMWMPELIAMAGANPLVTKPGDHAPTLTREALAALSPDVVLVKPCGFSLERSLEELDVLRASLPWDTWRAVREGRVFIADGNAYFNRPGPRIVESLEILAACAHPDAFPDFRHRHRDTVVRLDANLARHAFDTDSSA
ncbi:cobalamin-binding protein [Pendulispora brunnea]|uniref:Cobalamin-binding protein n=1 Tax=Pendulispora brunnea TaxID=2905690 RepID=A0ABZ2JW67_9BACT